MRVELRDTGDLKAVAKALRSHADGKALRKELTRGLRGVLRPEVAKVRAAYLAAPGYKGRRSRSRATQPDLRVLLASATRLEVRTSGKRAGARIRVDGRRLPSGMRSLAAMWEGEKRWRHPVFGNPDIWVGQASRPTFYAAVRPSEAQARAEIDRVVGRVLDRIERAR